MQNGSNQHTEKPLKCGKLDQRINGVIPSELELQLNGVFALNLLYLLVLLELLVRVQLAWLFATKEKLLLAREE